MIFISVGLIPIQLAVRSVTHSCASSTAWPWNLVLHRSSFPYLFDIFNYSLRLPSLQSLSSYLSLFMATLYLESHLQGSLILLNNRCLQLQLHNQNLISSDPSFTLEFIPVLTFTTAWGLQPFSIGQHKLTLAQPSSNNKNRLPSFHKHLKQSTIFLPPISNHFKTTK